MHRTVREVALAEIEAAEPVREPGRTLVESMTRHGLLQPLDLRARADGTYELVDGGRRLGAARQLNWRTVAAIVEPAESAALSTHLRALLLNSQRQSLQSLHLAERVRAILRETGGSEAELARQIERGKSTVNAMPRVLSCPDLVAAIRQEGLEFGAAKAMTPLLPGPRRELLAELQSERERTGRFPAVRQVEQRVAAHQGRETLAPIAPEQFGALIEALQAQGIRLEIQASHATRSHATLTLKLTDADTRALNQALATTRQEWPRAA